MRVTTLDESSPLSYHTYNNGSGIPAYGASTYYSGLNTSHSLRVHTKPTVDIGASPFPELLNKGILRLSMVISANSSYSLIAKNSVAFGYFMEPPPDDVNFAYRVSGNIYSASALINPQIQYSVGVGYNVMSSDTILNQIGQVNENYPCVSIHETPLHSQVTAPGNAIYNVSFNFSLHDEGVPPIEASRIFFYIIARNSSNITAITLQPLVANLHVWRQYAPLKMYNQWEA